ncbi:MAG: type II toxin-antitoxin system Phd/YefM family antitoxin [Caldisericia bacterium]|nr:type II toxin-antitoxin system Phd/YefM family antitoxin [Caldisericia bacterium]
MSILSITDLRKNLYKVIKNVVQMNEPIMITNKNSDETAVIISQKSWEDMKETIYLLSHRDARETILKELSKPIEEGTELNWRNGA